MPAGIGTRPGSCRAAVSGGGLQMAYHLSRPLLLRFLAARRAAADEAEDILQDLFVKLETQKVGPVAEPVSYLCRMADNLLVDRRRSAARRTIREQAWMDCQAGSEADDRPNAEQLMIGRDALATVSAALSALPDRTRAVFGKFRIDELPQKQIAAELGISVSAVEKHLRKAYGAVIEAKSRLDADLAAPHRL